jgi:VWFA-related protein
MRRLCAVVIWLAAAAPVLGQVPASPPEQGPTFRTGVDVVSVDVAVVDRNGKPVADLRAPEFTVRIDGEERRVVSAELVKVDIEAAKKQVADKSETFFTSNLAPINGRMILIAVDQSNVRPGSMTAIMTAAQKFVDHLSPLDQVAFIAFPEPGPQVNFTSDRLRVKQAMRGLIGQSSPIGLNNYNIGTSEALAIYDKRDPVVLADVMARECRGLTVDQRSECERDIINEASQLAARVRTTAEQSRVAIRDILTRLQFIDGHKSTILISEGLAIDDTNEIDSIVALAGRARTSISIMSVDLQANDITIAQAPPTRSQDRRLQMTGLESLAVQSRGALYFIAGTGENIFDRISSELSAYYLLGVEQRPADANQSRRRIDVSVRRQNVIIRSRQAFVLSPTLNARRSVDDSLRDALLSPFPVSGLPLRVTTFAQQDPASTRVQMVIAADVDQPGAAAGDYTIGFLVIDAQNKVAASWTNRQRLVPASTSAGAPLSFRAAVALEPGTYSLRFAAVDAAGRRGSVARSVAAWKLLGEEFAVGDLIVGAPPAPGSGLTVAVEPHVAAEGMAAYVELYSTTAATFDATNVRFEIADDADSPALATLPVQLLPGRQETWRVASGLVAARALPPGRYVARAHVTRGGKTIAILSRPFVLDAAAPADAAPRMAAAAMTFGQSLPKFDSQVVVTSAVLTPMLDVVGKRSAALEEAMIEARAGRYGPAALEALTAGDQTAAAFLRGLDFFIKGQLDQALTQLTLAAGPRREFFPAAFYLGAVYAAAGRDRDAAGIWQSSFGTEPRPALAYVMAADARLRDGLAPAAVDILKPAHAREPANDDVATRLGIAQIIAGQHIDAIPVLDGVLTRRPADPFYLSAAIVAHYEAVRGGMVLSTADRAKLRKYGAAYAGPERALLDKYLETLDVR